MKNIKINLKRFAGYTLVSMMVLTPAFAFAKEGGRGGNSGENSNRGRGNSSVQIKNSVAQLATSFRSSFATSTRRDGKNPVSQLARSFNSGRGDDNEGDNNKGKNNLRDCFVRLSNLTIANILNFNFPNTTTLAQICAGTATSTTPDITAPVISSVTTTAGTSSIIVVVNTNEASNVKVFFSTTTPVDTSASSTSFVQSVGLGTSTILTISGLSASTTYNLVAKVTDASNNSSLSGNTVVTTTGTPVVLPVISGLSTVTASNSIDVLWTTNVPATSRVYFSTTTPVSTSTASFVESLSLVTSHMLHAPSLIASTIYHLIVTSKDSLGNIVNSFEFPITTPSI